MTLLTTSVLTKSNLSKAMAALLFSSLGAACGSSSGTSSSADGGNGGTDAQSSTDGKSSKDSPGSTDDGSAADDGPVTDDGTMADDTTAPEDAIEEDEASVSEGGDAGSTLPVNLGTAGDYVILAKSGISTVPTSAITGNIGASPVTATAITGFSLTADATKVFSTSTQVTGKVYASNYAAPTPSNLTTAIGDMQTAFTDAAGRAPGVTELGAGNIGGMTLTPGVYKWSSALLIPTDITLTGKATDIWIFQIAQTLKLSSATKIILAGGAVPKHIFWEVAGAVDLGTTSSLEGIILTKTMIALRTGASIHGRLLAQTEVSIDSSTVVEP
jgi:hypothetical protein